VAQFHTQQDCCVRFAVVVTFHDATLATGRELPLTQTGIPQAGKRQLSWRAKHHLKNFRRKLTYSIFRLFTSKIGVINGSLR
jgi:hypothetical protein